MAKVQCTTDCPQYDSIVEMVWEVKNFPLISQLCQNSGLDSSEVYVDGINDVQISPLKLRMSFYSKIPGTNNMINQFYENEVVKNIDDFVMCDFEITGAPSNMGLAGKIEIENVWGEKQSGSLGDLDRGEFDKTSRVFKNMFQVYGNTSAGHYIGNDNSKYLIDKTFDALTIRLELHSPGPFINTCDSPVTNLNDIGPVKGNDADLIYLADKYDVPGLLELTLKRLPDTDDKMVVDVDDKMMMELLET